MTTALADLVDPFRREVAVPGTFNTAYPATLESHIVGALMDSFAEAQLDGWFSSYALDLNAQEITPDVSLSGQALIINYAASRLIRAEMRAATNVRYKAGPVEYEVSRPATVYTALLKDLAARRDQLIKAAATGARVDYVLDAYGARATGLFFLGEAPGVLSIAGLP